VLVNSYLINWDNGSNKTPRAEVNNIRTTKISTGKLTYFYQRHALYERLFQKRGRDEVL
jgi:hypothetical protein